MARELEVRRPGHDVRVSDARLETGEAASASPWPEVMSVDQAAEFLQMKSRPLSDMARDGRIPSRKAGGAWKFSRPALHRWLAHEIEAPADKPPAAARGTDR